MDTELGSGFDRGLSSAEAAGRLQQFGPNVVAQPAESWLRALAGKLWAPLPWMLEATILLELFLGHRPQAHSVHVAARFTETYCPPNRAPLMKDVGWIGPTRCR
jgi:H+-transporting ATPase